MKEMILILAPFECKLCEQVKKLLPSYCRSRGWKLTQIVDEESEYDIEYYPHIQIKINDTIVDTIEGFTRPELFKKLIQYN